MDMIISAILGFLASQLHGTSGNGFSSKTNYIIALIACVAAGFAGEAYKVFHSGAQLDISSILGDIGTAFVVSQTYYQAFIKGVPPSDTPTTTTTPNV